MNTSIFIGDFAIILMSSKITAHT